MSCQYAVTGQVFERNIMVILPMVSDCMNVLLYVDRLIWRATMTAEEERQCRYVVENRIISEGDVWF